MQDWEIEVADPSRCSEFISGYESHSLNEDERFTLMWTILESFELLETNLDGSLDWQRVLFHLEADMEVHISTVWYWSALEAESPDPAWRIAPYMREILNRHRSRFESQ